MNRIEPAVQYAESIAADNYHGYSQPRRVIAKTPAEALAIKDGDCSSTTLNGLVVAGIDIGAATVTANMLQPLIDAGFVDVKSSVNMETGEGLQRCDVLLRPPTKERSGHTGFITGRNAVTHKVEMVQAAGDFDGKAGDLSGREITIIPYYSSGNFKYVLRYKGGTEEMLQKGSTSTVLINALKIQLNALGYNLAYDGVFDDALVETLKYEQKNQAIPVTGIADDATMLRIAELIYNKAKNPIVDSGKVEALEKAIADIKATVAKY